MSGKWIRKPTGSTAVVFIHGILSNGETCWKHENGAYWPTLIKEDTNLKQVGIYIFSYETSIFSGTYSLSDVVDALKEYMKLDEVIDCKRIIFVCHSMGGIVARKYIVERRTELIDRNTTIGLFLIASPSLGATYANWLSPLAQFLGHLQADAMRFSQNNTWLNSLDKEFVNVKEAGRLGITGKELVEDKFIVLRKWLKRQVVEPFSGARYFGEPFKVPESDHFSIAKPSSPNSIQHRLLCAFIIERLASEQSPEVRSATYSAESTKQRVESILEKTSLEKKSPASTFDEVVERFRKEQEARFKQSDNTLKKIRKLLDGIKQAKSNDIEDPE